MRPYVYWIVLAIIFAIGVVAWRMRVQRALRKALHQPEPRAHSIDIGPKTARRRAQIASFGSLLELRPGAGEIRDESELPLPKAEMLDALMTELVLERDPMRQDSLAAAALVLCEFQPAVGPVPLSPLGYQMKLPTNADGMNQAELMALAQRIASNDGQDRYQILAPAVAKESDAVMNKIALAKKFADAMPREKREQLLAQ